MSNAKIGEMRLWESDTILTDNLLDLTLILIHFRKTTFMATKSSLNSPCSTKMIKESGFLTPQTALFTQTQMAWRCKKDDWTSGPLGISKRITPEATRTFQPITTRSIQPSRLKFFGPREERDRFCCGGSRRAMGAAALPPPPRARIRAGSCYRRSAAVAASVAALVGGTRKEALFGE